MKEKIEILPLNIAEVMTWLQAKLKEIESNYPEIEVWESIRNCNELSRVAYLRAFYK